MDEHPIELIRDLDKTYDDIGAEQAQIKQPKGALDQRWCSVILTFRAVAPQNVKPMLIFPLQPYKKKSHGDIEYIDPSRPTNVVIEEEMKKYDPRVEVV